MQTYGVHVNGYTIKPDGSHMWIARRSKDKPTFPGKLDHIVAGGQSFGIRRGAWQQYACARDTLLGSCN